MADQAALAALLDRAADVFGLAGELGQAFEQQALQPNETVSAISPWKNFAATFDHFCQAVEELGDSIQAPPDGFESVAAELKRAAKAAVAIRNPMQRGGGISFIDYADYFPELKAVWHDGLLALKAARSVGGQGDMLAALAEDAGASTPASPALPDDALAALRARNAALRVVEVEKQQQEADFRAARQPHVEAMRAWDRVNDCTRAWWWDGYSVAPEAYAPFLGRLAVALAEFTAAAKQAEYAENIRRLRVDDFDEDDRDAIAAVQFALDHEVDAVVAYLREAFPADLHPDRRTHFFRDGLPYGVFQPDAPDHSTPFARTSLFDLIGRAIGRLNAKPDLLRAYVWDDPETLNVSAINAAANAVGLGPIFSIGEAEDWAHAPNLPPDDPVNQRKVECLTIFHPDRSAFRIRRSGAQLDDSTSLPTSEVLDRLRAWSQLAAGAQPPRDAASGAASLGDGQKTEPARNHQPPKKRKRSTERGEGRAKLIPALTKYHKYADGGCLIVEPIGNNELARLAGVDKATASAFFKQQFKGHGKYRAICADAASLATALKLLNGEFAPHLLYGAKPPDYDDRDEE